MRIGDQPRAMVTVDGFQGSPTQFRDLIDAYREKAAEQLEDARLLAKGWWRIGNQDGDQSEHIAESKRRLARRLLGLAKAYEDLGR
jgi:hypothetical protein